MFDSFIVWFISVSQSCCTLFVVIYRYISQKYISFCVTLIKSFIVCVCACTHACVCACIFTCVSGATCVTVYVHAHPCVHAGMYVCMFVCVWKYRYTFSSHFLFSWISDHCPSEQLLTDWQSHSGGDAKPDCGFHQYECYKQVSMETP